MSPRTLKWLDWAGRGGFVAKGAVYAIIAWYALAVALGKGGAFLDKEDVAKTVGLQPFGKGLLFALGVGLACYAAWRFVQATANPRGEDGAKGIAKRIGWAGSGVVHAALAFTVLEPPTHTAPNEHYVNFQSRRKPTAFNASYAPPLRCAGDSRTIGRACARRHARPPRPRRSEMLDLALHAEVCVCNGERQRNRNERTEEPCGELHGPTV